MFLVSGQALLILVGLISGLAAVGQIKAGQLLLSPVVSIANGFSVAATILARQRYERRGRRSAAAVVVAVSGLLAMLTVLWTVLVLSFPNHAGNAVLGTSWENARTVLPLLCATVAISSFSAGALILVRVCRGPQSTLRARLATSWCEPTFGAIGALVGGAPGACVGMVAAQGTAVGVWWRWSAESHTPAPEGDVATIRHGSLG